MPNPSFDNIDEELNTAKQVHPENVGALTREQLLPKAAAAPEGHDVPGHDHAHAAKTALATPTSTPATTTLRRPRPRPGRRLPYLVPGISLVLLLAGIALDYYEVGFFSGYRAARSGLGWPTCWWAGKCCARPC